LSPGANIPEEEEGKPSPVSSPVGHGEEKDRRWDVAPTADAQLTAEIKNLREKLAAAHTRTNEFE
jgi:hypothetical protein